LSGAQLVCQLSGAGRGLLTPADGFRLDRAVGADVPATALLITAENHSS
jgi:hypothetical protein